MTGPITELTTTEGYGRVPYRDEVMGGGTRSVIDFRDRWTWPGEVVVTPMKAGGNYKTLDAQAQGGEGQPVRPNADFGVSSGDIAFDGQVGKKLLLPDVWKLRPGLLDFSMTFWLQLGPLIANGYNNRLAGAGTSGGGDNAWELTPVGNAANEVVDLIWYTRTGAAGWSLGSIPGFHVPSRLFNSAAHQLSLRYLETPDRTHFTQFCALDGFLIGARASVPRIADFPASVADAHIGCPATYVGSSFNGNFRRGIYDEPSLSPERDWLEMVQLDWEANRTRMGAI